jgi:hypothetical protein
MDRSPVAYGGCVPTCALWMMRMCKVISVLPDGCGLHAEVVGRIVIHT